MNQGIKRKHQLDMTDTTNTVPSKKQSIDDANGDDKNKSSNDHGSGSAADDKKGNGGGGGGGCPVPPPVPDHLFLELKSLPAAGTYKVSGHCNSAIGCRLNGPVGIANARCLLFADSLNHCVRALDGSDGTTPHTRMTSIRTNLFVVAF